MSSARGTPPKILCVDDGVSSLEVRRALLTQMGYAVLIATDPAAAMAIVDEEFDIDLMVLDYSFPGHVSGEDLAHRIRAKRKARLRLRAVIERPKAEVVSN